MTTTPKRLSKSEERDQSWVDNSFMVGKDDIGDEYAEIYRKYSSAMGKYTDSSLGGSWVINPIPQFCRYADPRETALYSLHGPAQSGMGDYYSYAIDDNYQKVHMRFGVPSFNSVARFVANCYSIELSSLARTGRAPGVMFQLGRAAGAVVALPLALPLLVARGVKFLVNNQSSKYYTLKPTMHNYWSAVSHMVNSIGATLQIVPRPMNEEPEPYPTFTAEERETFGHDLPTIFHSSGMIDMLAVATRAQATSQAFHDQLNTYLKKATDPRERSRRLLKLAMNNSEGAALRAEATKNINVIGLQAYLDNVLNDDMYKEHSVAETGEGSDKGIEYMPLDPNENKMYLEAMSTAFENQRKEATEFVTFRVSNTGAQSESFSTTSKESGIADTINSMSASTRSTKFDFAYGNTGIGLVDSAIQGITSFFQGAAHQIGLDGLGLLAGNAFVDIPKMPDSTSAEINNFSFNIPLRAPYGHDLSRMINEIIPACCILAGVLPQSTGRHSYTSPLLVEVFCRGRVHIRCGMITSVQITRGAGDIGWLQNGRWMGTDLAVTVADMTSVVHMPLQAHNGFFSNIPGKVAGVLEDSANKHVRNVNSTLGTTIDEGIFSNTLTTAVASVTTGTYDDDSLFSDYMNILGSVEFDILVSRLANWALRARRQAYMYHQFKSPYYIMSSAMSGMAGDVFKAMSERTNRK